MKSVAQKNKVVLRLLNQNSTNGAYCRRMTITCFADVSYKLNTKGRITFSPPTQAVGPNSCIASIILKEFKLGAKVSLDKGSKVLFWTGG
jgi:hypothetical protein